MNTTNTNTTTTFYQPFAYNPLPTIINMAVHITNFVVGFPLHCYMVKLLLSPGRVLDASVVFDLSQAVSEILFSMAMPFAILCYASLKLCMLPSLGFLYGCCMTGRPLFQCCVCVERYLAVVHPIIFLRSRPIRRRITCVAVIWVCALLDGAVCLIYFPDLPHWVFAIVYFIVLVTDVFCCLSILKALLQPKPGDCQTEDPAMNSGKKRAFEIVLVNLLTLLVQIIPSTAVTGLSPFIGQLQFDVAITVSFISNIIPGFVQPLFFLRRVGKLTCKRHC